MISKESLKEAVDSSISLVYQKFILSKNEENKNKLFCFYEGLDASYYSPRIRNIYDNDILIFCCKNKNNVIKLYNKISIYKMEFKLGFFIDKDFDDSIENSDFYETPTYSIENFYIDSCCLKTILNDIFYINNTDKEFNEIINLYENQLDDYCNKILLFNAWYYTLKKKKKTENLETTNVSLDVKLPNSLLILEILNIKSNYDYNKIIGLYPKAIIVAEDQVLESKAKLLEHNLPSILRGKFLIEFMIKFLEFLVDDSKKTQKYVKQNITFHTDRKIFLGQLSHHAKTPECLINYVSSFKTTIAA